MELIYNQPCEGRTNAKHISVLEVKEVVNILNTECDLCHKELLQKFIWYFENLDHYKTTTEGLEASEDGFKTSITLQF
jgi:hypothetical protein